MAEEPPRGSYAVRYVCMYIARIAGYLISMTITLGPIARLNSLGICILSLRVEGLGAIMFCF